MENKMIEYLNEHEDQVKKWEDQNPEAAAKIRRKAIEAMKENPEMMNPYCSPDKCVSRRIVGESNASVWRSM